MIIIRPQNYVFFLSFPSRKHFLYYPPLSFCRLGGTDAADFTDFHGSGPAVFAGCRIGVRDDEAANDGLPK